MPSESVEPPRRKRSSPDEQARERVIQEHAAPCMGVAPSKRRRSDAEPQDDAKHNPEEPALAGAPEGELFLVTVRTRDELSALEDADKAQQELVTLLNELEPRDDVSWAREFQALDELRCLAQFHQEQARQMLEQDVLKKLVLPAVGNLRSAMARNALLCVQELVVELPQTAQHFVDVVPVLLGRASSEKQFLRDLARDVLDSALDAGAHEALLQPLLATSTTEKNAQIVSVAGLYVAKSVGKMDHARLRSFVLDRGSFFDEMAAFLNCKVVECKAATRRTCQHTRRVIGNEAFVALVKDKLSGSAQLDVLKASEARKAAKPGHAKSSIRERMLQMKRQQQMKVQSEGGDVSVVVVAPPPPRSRASSTQQTPSL